MPCTLSVSTSSNDLICDDGQGRNSRKPIAADQIRDWIARYDRLVHRHDDAELVRLGRDIAAWLDGDDLWLTGALEHATGPVCLELHSEALFDIPWEVMATATGGPLAEDAIRPFQVVRRLGGAGSPQIPSHGDLAVLFMASEVEGQSALSYEQEESRFLDATRNLRGQFHLRVEETGSLAGLQARLTEQGGTDVLHLTCHGNIAEDLGPYLALESETGTLDPVTAGQLLAALGGSPPGLVFLSACRTAQQAPMLRPLVRDLVRGGVANCLGWAGSVFDQDAALFAATLYAHLAQGDALPLAVAQARRDLLQRHRSAPEQGHHWHLARLYIGPQGGGSLRQSGQPKRPPPKIDADRAFLDKAAQQSPVTPQHHFVGRRRQIQRALGHWQNGSSAGVLIHGLGHLGKSSLAARLVDRLKDRYQPLVLFGRYDTGTVFHKLVEALPPDLRAGFRNTWSDAASNAELLRDALETALAGPFAGTGRPILLVIDDLERLLDPQSGAHRTRFATRAAVEVMTAILGAFDTAGPGGSRLLITSRYTFTLPVQGRDLADSLCAIPLPPLQPVEQRKQIAALGGDILLADDDKRHLCRDIITVSAGHPGLQACLLRPLLDLPKTDGLAACQAALAAVRNYHTTGTLPQSTDALGVFFEQLALSAYCNLLTEPERNLAQALTLFDRLVPWSILVLAGDAFGVPDAETALWRLRGLGLIDLYHWGDGDHGTLTALIRPLLPALTPEQAKLLARAVVRPLYAADRTRHGTLPHAADTRSLATLALCAEGPADILRDTVTIAGEWLFYACHNAQDGWELMQTALSRLPNPPNGPMLPLLRLAIACTERLGQGAEQDRLLALALAVPDADPTARAMLESDLADRLFQTGKLTEAEAALNRALAQFNALGDIRSTAVTWGQIADIMFQRGDYDEALRIHQKEELPVYAQLGDIRSTAVTWGQIADILFQRGTYDEALRIYRQELLPVFTQLDDIRATAVTWGKIGDILFRRGAYDEALRIRQQEQLPVFDQLGDIRETAITWGKIADILFQRGAYDEALCIRQQEQLPVFAQLGDIRSTAVASGKIADILFRRGNYDEALRIRQQEELPVYAQLKDQDGVAAALYGCAMIRWHGQKRLEQEAGVIEQELANSFAIILQLQRPDGIAAVAPAYGEILLHRQAIAEARAILQQADDALAKVNCDRGEIQAMLAKLP